MQSNCNRCELEALVEEIGRAQKSDGSVSMLMNLVGKVVWEQGLDEDL